jgi:hypothetical protein
MQEPLARGGDDKTQSGTKKSEPGKALAKDSKKSPGADDEVKPGPYPEDDLLPAVERGYNGSGAYR